MKKLLFLIFLFSTLSYSQNLVEKFNSYQNRYEYFDANGNMIAYKTYNTYKKQWETYYIQTNKTYKRIDENFELQYKIMAEKQKKYDLNRKEVEKRVTYLNGALEYAIFYDGVTSKEQANAAKNRFNNCLNQVNAQNYDYSNNELTNSVINYLTECLKSICKDLNKTETLKFYQL